MKKTTFAMAIMFLIVLAFAYAEITVSGSGQIGEENHGFVINTLPAASTSQVIIPALQQKEPAIIIEQLSTARIIKPCGQANFSFKITNKQNKQNIYTFTVDDFEGTAFITTNLILSSKEAKIVDLTLVPVCTSEKVLNPKIHIETGDEEAYLPLIINIDGIYIDEDNCLYHFNESICDSPYYLRIESGKSITLDLSKWFYDPDSDNLQYSFTSSANLDVKISKDTARIKPREDWLGTEDLAFYASDEKGGKAESKTFYLHAVNGNLSLWDKLLILLGF